MAITIVDVAELPAEVASRIGFGTPLPEPLPLDSLEAGQSIRIPFADVSRHGIRKAGNALRVRAHRTGKRLGCHFHVNQGHDAFYVTKAANA